MTKALKIHLLRPDCTSLAMCGKITENSTTDPETISCKTCSGLYRTNMEWYSQLRNKQLETTDVTGKGDIYTRLDVEAGLKRLGWQESAIAELLDKTSVFRNVFLRSEVRRRSDVWLA